MNTYYLFLITLKSDKSSNPQYIKITYGQNPERAIFHVNESTNYIAELHEVLDSTEDVQQVKNWKSYIKEQVPILTEEMGKEITKQGYSDLCLYDRLHDVLDAFERAKAGALPDSYIKREKDAQKPIQPSRKALTIEDLTKRETVIHKELFPVNKKRDLENWLTHKTPEQVRKHLPAYMHNKGISTEEVKELLIQIFLQ